MNQRIRGRRWVLPVFTVRRGYVAMILCRDEPMALLRASEVWERGLVGWPVPVGGAACRVVDTGAAGHED